MKYLSASLFIIAMITVFYGPTRLSAQPPDRLHYQGRLTDSSGDPITVATTVYFSLWEGGTAATASSGTELYLESAVVTPNTVGYFEHRVGAGSVISGTLTADVFETASPVYLQIAVGSVGAVLLPRVQMTTVPYAYIAQRVVESSAGAGAYSITDTTGGDVVCGDLLTITGEGLADARVSIGGKWAPIKTQSSSSLSCIVPSGLAMGPQEVVVVPADLSDASGLAGTIDLHRLAIGVSVSGTNDNIFVVDAADETLKHEIDSGDYSLDDEYAPLTIAFANHGGLALVPDNRSGVIYAIDLTAEPPAVADSIDLGTARAVAVAVSADSKTAVGATRSNDMLRPFTIGQAFPPYSSAAFGSLDTALSDLPSGFEPRGIAFIGDGLLLACGTGDTGRVIAYHRIGESTDFEGTLNDFEDPLVVSSINAPISMLPTPDKSGVMMVTGSVSNLKIYLVAPEGLTTSVSPASVTGGASALQMAANAADSTIITADATNDLVYLLRWNGDSLQRAGQLVGPELSTTSVQIAAMDPVDGSIVAVGTDNSTCLLYRRTGGALELITELALASTGRDTLALAFQP